MNPTCGRQADGLATVGRVFYLGKKGWIGMESEKKKPFGNLDDAQLLALCIYGEARNQGLDGMLAVGSVIMNRVRRQSWMGKTVKEVILKAEQFSCFNDDDPETPRNEEDPNLDQLIEIAGDFLGHTQKDDTLKETYWVAVGIRDQYLKSNVGPATNYHAKEVNPGWAGKMKFVKKIGDHLFYA